MRRVGMTFDSERAKEAGSRGGKAKAANRLTLERVTTELGSLESVDDAMRRLDRLNVWIAAGLLSGSAGSAAVPSIEVWIKANESKLTKKVVDELSIRSP